MLRQAPGHTIPMDRPGRWTASTDRVTQRLGKPPGDGERMLTLDDIQQRLAHHRAELRTRFGVRRLAIFGSYVRGEQTAASDIDILAELERPTGWEIVDLHAYLEDLLGLKVHLTTLGALRRKPWLWQAIQEELIYV